MATQHIVAIEIGSSKVVGAVAEKSSSGYIYIDKLEVEPLSVTAVRYGCIQNVEAVKGCVNNVLKKLENRLDGKIIGVYVGLSGRSLHSEVSEVSRDLDPLRPITQDIISRIIKDAGKNVVRDADVLEVVPRSYMVDHTETTSPSGQFGNTIDIKVNVITAKQTINLNLGRVMNSCCNVIGCLVTPLVVADEVLQENEKLLGTMLVDIGAETTTVSIYKHGYLMHLVTLPLGGRNITRDISTSLGVLEETAERVKKNINNPLDEHVDNTNIDGVNSAEAANYIKARTGEIIANINQQIAYAGLTPADLHNVVLLGGGAQLQGIRSKIESETHLKVRMASSPQHLNIAPSINRKEYVQVFSLIAMAANIIPDGETCAIISNVPAAEDEYDGYGSQDDPLTSGLDFQEEKLPAARSRDDEMPQRQEGSKPQGKSRRGSRKAWFERLKNGIDKIMSEPEEENEE